VSPHTTKQQCYILDLQPIIESKWSIVKVKDLFKKDRVVGINLRQIKEKLKDGVIRNGVGCGVS